MGISEVAVRRPVFATVLSLLLIIFGLVSLERLGLRPKTVENHRAWVMERIGARNIAELVRLAMKYDRRS